MASGLPALLAGAAVLVLVGLPSRPRLPPAEATTLTRGARGRRLAVVGCALLWLAGPAVVLSGALALGSAHRWWVGRRRRRLEQAERDGAAEALAVLSAELRAGRPTGAALEGAAEVATGPLALALHAAAAGGQLGADPADVLLARATGSAVPELLTGLGACWRVCAGTGSSLATAVERLADGLAAEHAQRLAIDAELAGPRATAGLLAVLPLAGICLAAGLGAHPLRLLLHTPVGLACLAAGVGLDALGVWWTGRLVASARRPR